MISDSILNTQEISLLYVLLDYAAHILGPDRAAIPAKVKQKLVQVNEVYHVIQEDGMEIAGLVAIRLALESAIQERKIVAFTYTRYDADYSVEPYRIVHASGFWYLVACHEGKLKKFLLDFIEGVAVDGSGNVYVGDGSNNRIQKFNSSGTYITQWSTEIYGCASIAVDSNGNVYVGATQKIVKFSNSGPYLTP